MGQVVVNGALVKCSCGVAPATLCATSQTKVMIGGVPAATIQDAQKMNIPPFGMCTSLANPQVAAATAAALGVLTPQPCVPALTGTWIPSKPSVLVDGKTILTSDCQLMCMYAGAVTVVSPGQAKTVV